MTARYHSDVRGRFVSTSNAPESGDGKFETFTELPVDRAIAEDAGRLRRQTGIRIADALIAASARLHGLALATRNLRDFERVPELTVRAPR